jgi:RimJ/RimL family protein N-acetyltransferase
VSTTISSPSQKNLHYVGLRKLLARCMHTVVLRRTSFGLLRDSTTSWQVPVAKDPIMVRELASTDIPLMLPEQLANIDRRERAQINLRRKLLSQNVPTCFVAIDQRSSHPCFIQWAFDQSQNDFIADFFKGRFPWLKPGQVLLENAYTHPDFRGKGVMPVAMSLIADLLSGNGVREIMTFVETTNVPSLKGCLRAGFRPFVTRKDISLCGGLTRQRSFEPIPADVNLDFSKLPVSLLEPKEERQNPSVL